MNMKIVEYKKSYNKKDMLEAANNDASFDILYMRKIWVCLREELGYSQIPSPQYIFADGRTKCPGVFFEAMKSWAVNTSSVEEFKREFKRMEGFVLPEAHMRARTTLSVWDPQSIQFFMTSDECRDHQFDKSESVVSLSVCLFAPRGGGLL